MTNRSAWTRCATKRGQPVVVAEPNLLGRHRVVLVDERQRPHLEQLVQRALGVSVVRASHDVFGGQQHLADGDAVLGERLGVAVHEQPLTDARRRLLSGQITRTGAQPQRLEPCRDRARRNQDNLGAGARRFASASTSARCALVDHRLPVQSVTTNPP